MRKINKSVPPQSFSSLMSSRGKPSNWDEFHKNNKDVFNDCRETILINEQNCLCGYTELPIQEITDCHIDHYKKKSLNPSFCFDWDNFIVATKDSDFGACFKDNHFCSCITDYLEIFNPVVDDCSTYFEYDSFGEIKPKNGLRIEEKTKAEKTIEVFNLKENSLNSRRQFVIQSIKSYMAGGLPAQAIEEALSPYGFKSVIEQELAIIP